MGTTYISLLLMVVVVASFSCPGVAQRVAPYPLYPDNGPSCNDPHVVCGLKELQEHFHILDTMWGRVAIEGLNQQQQSYEKFPISKQTSPNAVYEHTPISRVVNGQLLSGHLYRLDTPIEHFHFFPPMHGCPGRIRTSITAAAYDCKVAMNAGFFDMSTGVCLGNIISKGQTIQRSNANTTNFGLTKDGYFVAGYISQSDVQSMSFNELIAGAGWLVRNGKNNMDTETTVSFEFINLRAPRVAIGHDSQGRLLLIEVDGNEDLHTGLNLYEFADLCLAYGAVNAVNLDGGGSATVYEKGKIINHPSDYCSSGLANAVVCPRMVTTISCIV